MLDRCFATQQGVRANAPSSLLSFSMLAIMGAMEHLQEWVHIRLLITIEGMVPTEEFPARGTTTMTPPAQPTGGGAVNEAMLAQVAAVVLGAAMRSRDLQEGGNCESGGSNKAVNDNKSYIDFQLTRLKEFCCVQTNANLLPRWDYFKSTKDVDSQ